MQGIAGSRPDGHTTHGLAMLGGSLGGLESGGLTIDGEPEVLSDSGSVLLWDGKLLPGTWLVTEAIEQGMARLDKHPVMTICIKRSGKYLLSRSVPQKRHPRTVIS